MKKSELRQIIKEEIKWNVAENAFVKFLKNHLKGLNDAVKNKDEEKTKEYVKLIIQGLSNAARSQGIEI